MKNGEFEFKMTAKQAEHILRTECFTFQST